MINKNTHFLQLQIYEKQVMHFIIIVVIIIIIITKNTIYYYTYIFYFCTLAEFGGIKQIPSIY